MVRMCDESRDIAAHLAARSDGVRRFPVSVQGLFPYVVLGPIGSNQDQHKTTPHCFSSSCMRIGQNTGNLAPRYIRVGIPVKVGGHMETSL